ncbi:MAG: helix-hairpin-helix domain-containing protein [Ignavibacteriae bacterium]|nr:helix-hairpin-helix domain-containing protein [Ignavibacteriota bacterium]
MNLLAPLQKVGLTRREALATLMLSGTFIAGVGIRWLDENYLRPETPLPIFSYSSADSAYRFHTQRDSQSSAANTRLAPNAQRIPSININTATREQLELLPGIGPALADRILVYRKSIGRFRSVDQLLNVKGIGKKSLARLRPHVYVK